MSNRYNNSTSDISEAQSHVVSDDDAEKCETRERNKADKQCSAAHREVVLNTTRASLLPVIRCSALIKNKLS